MHIPLSKPYWGVREERAVVRSLRSTMGTGDGPNNHALEDALCRLTGARYTLSVTSCTHGLELAVSVLGVKAGDEVIVPSFTMTSTANAVVGAGGTPIFADIDRVFYNIDPIDIERKVTKHTKGIIVVHYAGMACAMDKIRDIAAKHNLWIIEDAAHAIGALFKGKPLGTWSDIGVFSFHGTKNISCGEGGAVVTDNRVLADQMEVYRANGTNRKAFLDGIVDKYSWVRLGSSYYLSDILASIVIEQLKQINLINIKRSHIASLYTKALSSYSHSIQLPTVPRYSIPNWHIYAIKFASVDVRRLFQSVMRKRGIEVSTHYVPLHSSPMGSSQSHSGTLPITENVASTLVRLPIYPGLSKTEVSYIIASARKALDLL